ncbi:hypothetical protein ACFY3N_20320 [Streptomyces sp. NPDC000348]|uniref:hypothetical protein n=1 Tax=Streptomyces sp. NPDC000348 TaxID=3364538 RepID=UPI0036AD9E6C
MCPRSGGKVRFQTRAVLGAPGALGAAMLDAAHPFTAGNDRSVGNRPLMRTGVVALGHL